MLRLCSTVLQRNVLIEHQIYCIWICLHFLFAKLCRANCSPHINFILMNTVRTVAAYASIRYLKRSQEEFRKTLSMESVGHWRTAITNVRIWVQKQIDANVKDFFFGVFVILSIFAKTRTNTNNVICVAGTESQTVYRLIVAWRFQSKSNSGDSMNHTLATDKSFKRSTRFPTSQTHSGI